jgi:hypothetical protein
MPDHRPDDESTDRRADRRTDRRADEQTDDRSEPAADAPPDAPPDDAAPDDAVPPPGGPGEPALTWAPPWWRVAGYALVGTAAIVVAGVADLAERLLSVDAAGRLLIAVVGLGLLGLAARDAVLRPTLRVGPAGIDVVDGIRRRHLPWAAVRRVRTGTLAHSRRLVHVRTVEIDTIDGPVLVSRHQLGAEPSAVAAEVEDRRLRHG